MNRLAWILTMTLCLVRADAAIAASWVSKQDYFSISLPEGFNIQKVVAVEGDIFFYITDGKVRYLEIYVGNAPSYPSIAMSSGGNIAEMKTRDMGFITEWNGRDIVAMEVIFLRLDDTGWPRYVYARTTDEALDQHLAQKILLSPNVQ